MGKVKVNVRDLKAFQKKLEQLSNEKERNEFMERCEKRLAADLIAKVIPRTPVGRYPAKTGMMGGTLRRGWTGGESEDPYVHAAKLPVNKIGGRYAIVVYNPTEYASYVEHGHRVVVPVKDKSEAGYHMEEKGHWEGHHMLENSENELKQEAPDIIQDMLDQWLKGLLS